MTIKLNHTIVASRDKKVSSAFLTQLFELPAAFAFGPFLCVQLANEVTLDFIDSDGEINPQHYAFLISEQEFDVIYGRIQSQKITYWADPGQRHANAINTRDGGRGLYFEDPSGHLLEILTRPYGSGGYDGKA